MSAQIPHDVFVAPRGISVGRRRRHALQQAERVVRIGTQETPRVTLFRRWFNPAILLVTLAACLLRYPDASLPAVCVLAVSAVLLTRRVVSPPDVQRAASEPHRYGVTITRTVLEWSVVAVMLALMVWAFDAATLLPRELLTSWFLAAGAVLALAHSISQRLASLLCAGANPSQRYVVVGVNEVGLEFQKRMQKVAADSEFRGYFDFRSLSRLSGVGQDFKGHCEKLAQYVIENEIDAVYIAIPIAATPRIKELLADLRNTTASIYFLPAIFALETVQPRYVDIDGMPALSVCDTPLQGMSGFRKRVADLVLAVVALAVLWPVMLAIGLAVRWSSPGPVLFRQKRYGMNGEEIVVYKFRSMTVCEDGPIVTQARERDHRVTSVGRMLRSTSLDELPQIFNVLEGTMSFVGPRPHAVAHNELYRRLISGYMIRHKVRPGITGWAQVNGARGETPTVDRMQQRVWYDIEYLRNWSLWLDLRILFTTVIQVIRRENAY
jgi:putative colanic acid biosynthesis UDP-glucose lipid carrier transferase